MPHIQYPKISCVVIGLNCAKTIVACLESILRCSYPDILEVIYIDGGSVDGSAAITKNIENVKVIELNLKNPNQAKERNAGWRLAKGEWVHFFDSQPLKPSKECLNGIER